MTKEFSQAFSDRFFSNVDSDRDFDRAAQDVPRATLHFPFMSSNHTKDVPESNSQIMRTSESAAYCGLLHIGHFIRAVAEQEFSRGQCAFGSDILQYHLSVTIKE
jgi:hypothetical protein